MGKAKRLRKARMRQRAYAYFALNLGADPKRWPPILRQDRRYGSPIRGRNPKVLAKRRRQRERLAHWAVFEQMWPSGKRLPLEEAIKLWDYRQSERFRQRVSAYAERLHAIAEGRA